MLYKLDEKQILLDYIELERYEAAKEGETKVAIRMLKDGRLSIEEAAEYFSTLTIKDLKKSRKKYCSHQNRKYRRIKFFLSLTVKPISVIIHISVSSLYPYRHSLTGKFTVSFA